VVRLWHILSIYYKGSTALVLAFFLQMLFKQLVINNNSFNSVLIKINYILIFLIKLIFNIVL